MTLESTIPQNTQLLTLNGTNTVSLGGLAVQVNSFPQQIDLLQAQMSQLSQYICSSIQLQPQLLPQAFKDLGIVAEKLQLALEQLQQQHQQLEAAREGIAIEHQH